MFSEKWGTTIDEAVDLALEDLKLTREEVEIEVLEEPSKGFLNLRNKLAKVRVTKKGTSEPEVVEEKVEVKENPKKEAFDKEAKKDLPVLDYSKEVKNHKGEIFLKDVTEKMGLDLKVSVFSTEDEKNVKIKLDGDNIGVIIGKKGQTLDALQYLTNLHVNRDKDREKEDFERIQIDANNYREKRQDTLIAIAGKLYSKSIRIKKNVRFDPMNSYERKIVHSYLQGKDNIKTVSEGKEPFRRVVIEYIK